MPKSRPMPPPPVEFQGEVRFEDVLESLDRQGRAFDPAALRGVYEFSAEKHKDQVRRSGRPYLTHPVAVAHLLAELKFDEVCVAVGLLHDVLEDTLTTKAVLESRFGEDIAELVDGVTKIGRHAYVRRDEAQADTFRKMILASARDIRVILVKLADRLHNLLTLEHLPPEKRRRISRETLEIYAPLAHRLGMSRVKGDLEDLSFYHLYPLQFSELYWKIEEKLKVGKEIAEEVRKMLADRLGEAGIDAEIGFRVKRYYSIFHKLRRQGIDISELYDYLAFRIVTTSLRDTYAALGVVHQTWRPIPGRFKDYIAMPKPNLYQSLHTSVVGKRGQPFEVQIRTREMDLVAEEGIAAHWRYKEGKNGDGGDEPEILWLRQLVEWQKEVQDPRTFLSALKVDLYPDEVYVFTPGGDVLSFPRGATPLDLAYKIHTDLGHHCSGARVNGKLVPLRTPLANGDLVEIVTSPSRVPSRDWLALVVTPRARSKIRQWLNTQQKKRAMEIGKRLLERELRKYRVSFKKILSGEKYERYLKDEGLSRLEDLYCRVGFGKTHPRLIAEKLLEPDQLAREAEKPSRIRRAVESILPSRGDSIEVKGQSDVLTYLAKCCSPLPGDEIVGYITRGRGVAVHSSDCPNVKNLLFNPEREMEVGWAAGRDELYRVTLAVETEDRPGVLALLTEAIAKQDSNIAHLDADTGSGRATIHVVVELKNRKHLERMMRQIGGLDGVRRVHRQMATPSLEKLEAGRPVPSG